MTDEENKPEIDNILPNNLAEFIVEELITSVENSFCDICEKHIGLLFHSTKDHDLAVRAKENLNKGNKGLVL